MNRRTLAPTLIAVVAAIALTGCAGTPPADPGMTSTGSSPTFPPSATAGPSLPSGVASPLPAGADISLAITIKDSPEAANRDFTVLCQGANVSAGSSVADPAAACQALERYGAAIFWPTVQNRNCTMQMGGPQVARVTGIFKGQGVDKTFDQSNGCEISDWNALSALFGNKSGVL